MTRGFKVFAAAPAAAIAVFLSVLAIAGFLLTTGTSVGVAIMGTLIVIALWLAFFAAIGRLLPDLSD